MSRIAGVNIPPQKHIVIGLQAIYGIGISRAKKICAAANVAESAKSIDLTDAELEALRVETVKYDIEGELRREVSMNIKEKMDMGSYEGHRHRHGLPLRGQRTSTNARTRKKRRKKK